jgi:hypothetical protein
MSDTTIDSGPKRNPNDFLAGRADEGTAILILTYVVIFYILVRIFK